MPRIGIIVALRVKPGRRQEIEALLREHASRTLAEEPGCERFELLRPLAASGEVDETRLMLDEVYRDQAAYDAHARNPRLAAVRDSYAALIDGRELTVCHLA